MPDPAKRLAASLRLTADAVMLDLQQGKVVEQVVAEHCRIRKWTLHAVNCRSNHIHVAVSAGNVPIERPREQFKAWCTRRLKAADPTRENWWTDRGWDVYIDD